MRVRYVSNHALSRFQQRVNAMVNSAQDILDLWEIADVASNDVLSVFGLERRRGFRYRVTSYQDVLFVMAVQDLTVVTVFGLDTTNDDLHDWKRIFVRKTK